MGDDAASGGFGSSGSSIGWLAGAAVLVFWAVGAYNRLVELRNRVVAQFAPLDAQMRQRHQLLREQAQLLAGELPALQPELDAMQAALSQAEAACAHARLQPASVAAITSLRVADEVLAATRARLPVELAGAPASADLAVRLAGNASALDFTRHQFNTAVEAYNAAAHQFPTWLVAAVFGLRAAAAL